ncbi:MAG: electron transfer flavoprotein subunit alpha/FixB family protein [Alphaproteobacteria bacterium]|nr:electron transfer flavoprotein subunit alpha/FixB family protein [Alphaproteobacteria bacterium]
MKVLILAEHDEQTLKPSTLNSITAGLALAQEVTVLVAGSDTQNVCSIVAKIEGVTQILKADAPELAHHLAEPMGQLLVSLAPSFTHILAPATTFGKNIMPRVAALLDVMQISDLTKIISADTFERPIYAGNAIETIQSLDAIKILTIRPTAFSTAPEGKETCPIDSVLLPTFTSLSQFIGLESTPSVRPELTSATVVVSGGRGLQSKEKFHLIEDLADCLKGAVGASRAAVDAGFVPNDYQVGQTGKVVAPQLYIAIGISGAIQHIAGMKDSKVIIAINKDPDAPIFQVADYGLVGDLFEIVPQLTAALKELHP